jgi:hypothetical protein
LLDKAGWFGHDSSTLDVGSQSDGSTTFTIDNLISKQVRQSEFYGRRTRKRSSNERPANSTDSAAGWDSNRPEAALCVAQSDFCPTQAGGEISNVPEDPDGASATVRSNPERVLDDDRPSAFSNQRLAISRRPDDEWFRQAKGATTMENLKSQSNEPQAEKQATPKQTYASPKATFVPLKLEERLAVCEKLPEGLGPSCATQPDLS